MVKCNFGIEVSSMRCRSRAACPFWGLVGPLFLIMAGWVIIPVLETYFTSMLELRWRRGLTDYMSQRWLSRNACCRIEGIGNNDNPDQRIAEDARDFIGNIIRMVMVFFQTLVTMGSFTDLIAAARAAGEAVIDPLAEARYQALFNMLKAISSQ